MPASYSPIRRVDQVEQVNQGVEIRLSCGHLVFEFFAPTTATLPCPQCPSTSGTEQGAGVAYPD